MKLNNITDIKQLFNYPLDSLLTEWVDNEIDVSLLSYEQLILLECQMRGVSKDFKEFAIALKEEMNERA